MLTMGDAMRDFPRLPHTKAILVHLSNESKGINGGPVSPYILHPTQPSPTQGPSCTGDPRYTNRTAHVE